eukprot:m.240092 g.240092  ORF g.240092 m.240092 type:complete len:885 (-) comp33758_c0_seq1:74-2728(-)
MQITTSGAYGCHGVDGTHGSASGSNGMTATSGTDGAHAVPISAQIRIEPLTSVLYLTLENVRDGVQTQPSNSIQSIVFCADGRDGGNGGCGGRGAKGKSGSWGSDASESSSGTDGGDGGPGGHGGHGGSGGRGGNAQPIVVNLNIDDVDTTLMVSHSQTGGKGGTGGLGGRGGAGGDGGIGGSSHSWTTTDSDGDVHHHSNSGGSNGSNGPRGRDGRNGIHGSDGCNADFYYNVEPLQTSFRVPFQLQVTDFFNMCNAENTYPFEPSDTLHVDVKVMNVEKMPSSRQLIECRLRPTDHIDASPHFTPMEQQLNTTETIDLHMTSTLTPNIITHTSNLVARTDVRVEGLHARIATIDPHLSDNSTRLIVQHPVKLNCVHITSTKILLSGSESFELDWLVESIASFPMGIDEPRQVETFVTVHSVAKEMILTLNAPIDDTTHHTYSKATDDTSITYTRPLRFASASTQQFGGTVRWSENAPYNHDVHFDIGVRMQRKDGVWITPICYKHVTRRVRSYVGHGDGEVLLITHQNTQEVHVDQVWEALGVYQLGVLDFWNADHNQGVLFEDVVSDFKKKTIVTLPGSTSGKTPSQAQIHSGIAKFQIRHFGPTTQPQTTVGVETYMPMLGLDDDQPMLLGHKGLGKSLHSKENGLRLAPYHKVEVRVHKGAWSSFLPAKVSHFLRFLRSNNVDRYTAVWDSVKRSLQADHFRKYLTHGKMSPERLLFHQHFVQSLIGLSQQLPRTQMWFVARNLKQFSTSQPQGPSWMALCALGLRHRHQKVAKSSTDVFADWLESTHMLFQHIPDEKQRRKLYRKWLLGKATREEEDAEQHQRRLQRQHQHQQKQHEHQPNMTATGTLSATEPQSHPPPSAPDWTDDKETVPLLSAVR